MEKTQHHVNIPCPYCDSKGSLHFWNRYVQDGFVFMIWKCVNCAAKVHQKRRRVKEEPKKKEK